MSPLASPETSAGEPGGGPLSLAVVILTHNEERHIERAIAHVRDIAETILVVDSFSTDQTVELAHANGARVLQNRFINYSRQFQWALDNGGITTDWIIRLDADEVIEPDLAAELRLELPRLPQDVVAANFKRKHVFMGRWIKYGGRYPLLLLRLWRNGHGRMEERWMDEHIVTWGGRVITMNGGFADVSLTDLTFFTDKHNKYATREALDVLNGRYGLFRSDGAEHLTTGQASLKRRIKERVYNRLPGFVGPTGYFLYRYVIQFGFLDGRAGTIYHLLQGFWYRFLVNAKVFELDTAIADCRTNAERLQKLTQLTGHQFEPTVRP